MGATSAAVAVTFLVLQPLAIIVASMLVGLVVYPIPTFCALRFARRNPGLGRVGLFLILAVPLPILGWIARPTLIKLIMSTLAAHISVNGSVGGVSIWILMNLPMLLALGGIAAGTIAVRIDRKRRPVL